MRKALIVGIDFYEDLVGLSGCVNDAHSVRSILERHADGTLNFPSPQLLTGTGASQPVEKQVLKEEVRGLFSDDAEIALLYFAGHGYIEDTGGFLCASDSATGDDGLSLNELMTIVNQSTARNKVVVLDSCHSGVTGNNPLMTGLAEISDGATILTHQLRISTRSRRLVAAQAYSPACSWMPSMVPQPTLSGTSHRAAYTHTSTSPSVPGRSASVFKTNVKTFVSLRKAEPPISLSDLRALTTLFPTPTHDFALDPSFEPERSRGEQDDPLVSDPDPANTAVFAVLQKHASVGLVRPVDAPHMWHAAMGSKSCELTVLGQHYWNLVDKRLI